MSWVTIIWSMNAAACLTMAGIHLIIWLNSRSAWGYLLFSFSAVAAAAIAACELQVMLADTVEQYGRAMWWGQIPLWVIFVSIVWFTRFHLRAGQPWLAWAVTGARTLVLILNAQATPNINFKAISGLRHIPFLGESVALAEGTLHPWGNLAKLSSLLLLAFLVNASIEVWRRGERRLAFSLGGSMILFITAGAVNAALVERRLIQSPYLISFAFLGTILVMGFELTRDVLRASRLVHDLQVSEAGLRESEERMTLAAEAAKFGVWINDVVRHEIWASNNWRALFGFSNSERIDDEGFLQRLHPEDRDTVNRAVTKALAGKGLYETEYRILLPDGQVRWIGSRGRVEFDCGGEPVLVRGVAFDITARKQVDAELQQQRSELAHLSRVSMLGELSGSLAHELNQPLTAILSNAQAALRFLAQDNVDLNELRDILTDIVNEDKRAGEVIRRLRLLLKKGEVQRQPLDVNDLVLEVLKILRSDLVNHGVTATTELSPALPLVHWDRVQLQQVMLNLVMNACDAMSGIAQDDRQVTIRTDLIETNVVRISVADCGTGISPDKLEQVFEPFFTTKPHGMGLGLAVCRTITSAHGGRMWVTNNPERGVSVHVTLNAGLGAAS